MVNEFEQLGHLVQDVRLPTLVVGPQQNDPNVYEYLDESTSLKSVLKLQPLLSR